MALPLRDWLHDRTTVDHTTLEGWNKPLPKGVGWLNTLGAVAVAILAIQALTGIFLAMYYSPHPDAAYETVRYIDRLPMGRLVHGVHRYADSALVIVLFLHLVRTYFQAAYKPPRELIWLSGIVLLTLVLGFGFTGYLLPWDQNAYWATIVRTKYAGGVPVFGPALLILLRGGSEIGALTITRFYAIHALLLPMLVLLVTQGHLLLAWRKGPTPPGSRVGETTPSVSRYVDHQLFKDAVAILAVFATLFLLAWVRPIEMEFKANPSDGTYHPHPEWYFLFLFQLVNDLGHIRGLDAIPSWVPALLIPGVAMTFVALAPWIDRHPERRARHRPLMLGVLSIGLLGVLGLGIRGALVLHTNATPRNSLFGRFTDGGEKALDPRLVASGKTAFNAARPVPCSACHNAYADYTSGDKLDLSGYGTKSLPGDVAGHAELEQMSFYDRYKAYVRGAVRPPNSGMPKYPPDQLSDQDLDSIGAYLSQDPVRARVEHANPRLPLKGGATLR